MTATVFYSWQSDLPNATNRGFIEKSLEVAIKELAREETLRVEAAIDRDTLGRPGAPSIGQTIFEKIANAAVFVADVSIIGTTLATDSSPSSRHVPNPNVCVELGYALAKLGEERVVLVHNTVYGGPDLLPFDLKFRRALGYEARIGDADRSGERKTLVSKLKEALRPILELKSEDPVAESPIDKLISTLEHGGTGQGARARDAVYSIIAESGFALS